MRPSTLVALALAMLGLSLYGVVSAFGLAPSALLLWVLAYTAALIIGVRQFSSQGMTPMGARVRVPGSGVPMALLLTIFAAKFVLGFVTGVHSPLLHSIGFVVAMSAVLGTLSGGFGARAVAVHRCANEAGAGA